MAWYFPLFKNFPQFSVIHTVKGFGLVNKAEVAVFLELSCFFNDPMNVGRSNDLWFFCLFYILPEYLEVQGSCTVEA